MTTPPKTREEWDGNLADLIDKIFKGQYWRPDSERILDSIMSLQAEVAKTKDDNQELHRQLCSANNALERLQTEQDLAKDALQAEVDRLAKLVTPPGYEMVPEGTMAVMYDLDNFQAEYKTCTRDNVPGNGYWGSKLLAVIEDCRSILTRHRATQDKEPT